MRYGYYIVITISNLALGHKVSSKNIYKDRKHVMSILREYDNVIRECILR